MDYGVSDPAGPSPRSQGQHRAIKILLAGGFGAGDATVGVAVPPAFEGAGAGGAAGAGAGAAAAGVGWAAGMVAAGLAADGAPLAPFAPVAAPSGR